MGKDYTDVAGYDLSKLMQNCGTAVYGTNYYLYRLVTEACAIVDAPQSFVQSVIKNLTDLYKMGEGPDFWGGYGASADDLGAFLTALAPYADDYKTYIDDAVELLEKNVSDAGYTSWGSANADSTAMALMAYSALDDQEKADKAYDLLCKFESKTTGVFTYDGEENSLATKDALTALGYYTDHLIGRIVIDPEDPTEPTTKKNAEKTCKQEHQGNHQEEHFQKIPGHRQQCRCRRRDGHYRCRRLPAAGQKAQINRSKHRPHLTRGCGFFVAFFTASVRNLRIS